MYVITSKQERRFWTRVDRTGLLDNDCWSWLGSLTPEGYGQVSVGTVATGGYKLAKAHRVAYQLTLGGPPDDLVIDHLCRNRKCCNPAHMEPVTIYENFRRGFTENHPVNKSRNQLRTVRKPRKELPISKPPRVSRVVIADQRITDTCKRCGWTWHRNPDGPSGHAGQTMS